MDVLFALESERIKQRLTKSDLARRAQLQPAAVRRIFSGGANPTLSTLSALARALKCEVHVNALAGTIGASDPTPVLSNASGSLLTEALPPIGTILADPPWRFQNRTGKVAPEHRRLSRYDTMSVDEICAVPVDSITQRKAHLYLWVPNALIGDGLRVLAAWGFTYKANIVWAKRRKDGGPDGRGVGFYFRNVTELLLFGTKGNLRTLAPGRRQVNMVETRKREHSRKPDEIYDIVESCSPGPFLELFARYSRPGWFAWGNEASDQVAPRGKRHPMYRGGDLNVPEDNALTAGARRPVKSGAEPRGVFGPLFANR
jgi:N6-adenosine-specific RNA methylase IME4/DNA-binding Xre family transcriptional regulator